MRDRLIFRVVQLLSVLPFGMLRGIGAVAGWVAFRLRIAERRYALTNVGLCFPELSARERCRLASRSLVESAKTLAEMPGIWSRPMSFSTGMVREERGRDVFEAARARARGVIVAAPHLGNWEIVGLYLQHLGPTTSLYRPPRQAFLGPLMQRGRSSGGARLVPVGARGVRALYDALRRGEVAGILPDQEPHSDASGAFAPFFGIPALTMTLLGRLARKSGASVVFCFAERLRGAPGYRIHWLAAPQGIADADPAVAAAALNRGVEDCVRLCPEQYQWGYRRFKRHPGGAPNPYRRPAPFRRGRNGKARSG